MDIGVCRLSADRVVPCRSYFGRINDPIHELVQHTGRRPTPNTYDSCSEQPSVPCAARTTRYEARATLSRQVSDPTVTPGHPWRYQTLPAKGSPQPVIYNSQQRPTSPSAHTFEKPTPRMLLALHARRTLCLQLSHCDGRDVPSREAPLRAPTCRSRHAVTCFQCHPSRDTATGGSSPAQLLRGAPRVVPRQTTG